jgi:hypothetical protein
MLWVVICGVAFASIVAVIGWLSRDSTQTQTRLGGMNAWKLVGATAAGFGVGVLTTLLLRLGDADETSVSEVATEQPALSLSAVPSSTASPTRSAEPRKTSERSTSPAKVAPRIETTTAFYFGRPSETVQIPGRYRGIQGPRELRVEVLRGREWSRFPLPVVTQQKGDFRAFVYLGRTGTYQLRIVDPEQRRSSRRLILQLF